MDHPEIANRWPGHCFGCSPANPHGLRLRFWRTEQGCYTKYTVPEHLCGFDRVAHGGIIATLLDEVSAWTVIACLGRLGVTREISIRYLRPVPTGTEVHVEGQVVSHDDRVAVVHAQITLPGHPVAEVLAESTSTWALPKLSNIARMAGLDEPALREYLEAMGRS